MSKSNGKVVEFSIKELLEAGVHYGHRRNYWNPKMSRYIYGIRNNIHIIDLQQTAVMLNRALGVLKQVASKNGKVLFVGTKDQAAESIKNSAERCGQYYVNFRWLGGMMTNWSTVSASIKTLEGYEAMLADEDLDITKKERVDLERKHDKLNKVLGGIRHLNGRPDVLFVVGSRNEALAVQEANKLNIPVIAIVDTNANPDVVDYAIPGNDDARKAIELYTYLASEAILKGIEQSLAAASADTKKVSAKEVVEIKQKDQKQDAKAQSAESEGQEVVFSEKAKEGLDADVEVAVVEKKAAPKVKKAPSAAKAAEKPAAKKATPAAKAEKPKSEAKPKAKADEEKAPKAEAKSAKPKA